MNKICIFLLIFQVIILYKGLGCGYRYDLRVKKKFQFQKIRVSLFGFFDGEILCQSEVLIVIDIVLFFGNFRVIILLLKVVGILKKEFLIKEFKIEKFKVLFCFFGEFNINEKFR